MKIKQRDNRTIILFVKVFILITFVGLLPIGFSQSNLIPVIFHELTFEEIDQWDMTLSTEGSFLTKDTSLNYSNKNSGKLVGRSVCYFDFTKNTAGREPVNFKNSPYSFFSWNFANISSNYIGVMFNYSDIQVYCVADFAGDYSNSSTEYWFLYDDNTTDYWYNHYLDLDEFGDTLYGVAIINSGYDDGINLESCNQTTNFACISIYHYGDAWTPPLSISTIPILLGLVIIGVTGSIIAHKKCKEKN